jgi:hypothetical protein
MVSVQARIASADANLKLSTGTCTVRRGLAYRLVPSRRFHGRALKRAGGSNSRGVACSRGGDLSTTIQNLPCCLADTNFTSCFYQYVR